MITSSLRLAACLSTVLALAGCGGDDTGDTSSTTSTTDTGKAAGTVLFDFTVSNTVKESAALVDPLKGPVYGAIYKQEDVTAVGPIEGAEDVASVEVADVDLTVDEVSVATWESGEIEPGAYVFLGFYDVDSNGSESKEPEEGDPVTLPSVNKFDITEGEQTSFTVRFDLVLN